MYFIPIALLLLGIGGISIGLFAWLDEGEFKMGIAIVLVGVFLFSTGIATVPALDERFCRQAAEFARTEHRRDFTMGCYLLNRDGQWVPIDAYRELYGNAGRE